jgi:hypothetical protein
MPTMKTALLACLVAASFAVMGLSAAQAATFTFQSPAGDVGSSTHTYSAGGLSLTADGLTNAFIFMGNLFAFGTTDLYDKTSGSDESGLGLANDPSGDHEITNGSFVRLTMPNGVFGVSFQMGSTTGTEAWAVWGCTAATSGCGSTPLLTGTDELVSHSLALKPFYLFTETTPSNSEEETFPNVLLENFTLTTTPLPATLPLLATGFGAMGLLGWRRKRRAAALAA